MEGPSVWRSREAHVGTGALASGWQRSERVVRSGRDGCRKRPGPGSTGPAGLTAWAPEQWGIATRQSRKWHLWLQQMHVHDCSRAIWGPCRSQAWDTARLLSRAQLQRLLLLLKTPPAALCSWEKWEKHRPLLSLSRGTSLSSLGGAARQQWPVCGAPQHSVCRPAGNLEPHTN